MAEYTIKIFGGEVIKACNNNWFYFIGDKEELGTINSYFYVCYNLGKIRKGGVHITTEYNDVKTAIRFIPGNKIIEITRVITEFD